VHGVEGLANDVRVEDDGIELPVEERLYRARGYLPPVEKLLRQEDYFGEKEAAERVKKETEAAEKTGHERDRQTFRDRFRRP